MLQLHQTEGGTDYAEFLHAPRKKFTDFGMLSFCCRTINLVVNFCSQMKT